MSPTSGPYDWTAARGMLDSMFGERLDAKLDLWRRARPDAQQPMLGFVHHRIFDVTPAEVAPLMCPPIDQWPFPEGTTQAAWSNRCVDNLGVSLPLVHAFHTMVEESGRVPTWKEVVAWFQDPTNHWRFITPAWNVWNHHPEHVRPPRGDWQRAIAWRIGNAYISFLREVDVLSRMRHTFNVPLRLHVVADAVLKVDFFTQHVVYGLFLENSFRHRKEGMRPRYAGVCEIKIPRRAAGWTAVSRPSDEHLEALAQFAHDADHFANRSRRRARSRTKTEPGPNTRTTVKAGRKARLAKGRETVRGKQGATA